MSRRIAPLLVAALSGCFPIQPLQPTGLSSFDVQVEGVFTPGSRQLLPVSTACAKAYGGEAQVPVEVRGAKECPYQIPRGEVEFDVVAFARDLNAQPINDFFGPVSFRVVPGELTGNYTFRWAAAKEGVAKATVKVAHLFGEVRVWAEDAPPKWEYADGGLAGDVSLLPIEPAVRTYSTGISPAVFFEAPTIAKLQQPDEFDNRSSPLLGQFLTLGMNPREGVLQQSCTDDPDNDGRPVTMIVTGTDQTGFFVTDLTACRLKEDLKDSAGSTQVRVPEPDGMLPGRYNGLFIYNFSYPEGLFPGDLLFTLAGSVQEFTSTTQLVFPSWSQEVFANPEERQARRAERLALVPISELNLRTCGLDDVADPFITDTMCGHNRRNMKMESLESALVRVRRIRFPQVFKSCDLNADKEVPFFCETKVGNEWVWGDCGAVGEPTVVTQERACHVDCAASQGEMTGKVCAERSTLQNFGQYVVEMGGPGPKEAGMDDSLPSRIETIALTAANARSGRSHPKGAQVRVFCNTPVRWRFGGSQAVAEASDPLLEANTLLEHHVESGGVAAFLVEGTPPAEAKCWVALNVSTKLNLITKDAIPDLQVDCTTDDPDAEKAERCKQLRAATFDVVGHLRHLQPGRPRWVLLPRDVEDFCCHPGPGLTCPKPIKPCQ